MLLEDQVIVRWSAALVGTIACISCATATRQPEPGTPSAYVVQRVTRPAGDCGAAADSVLAGQLQAQAPMLSSAGPPPTPPTPPAAERGKTAMVTLFVDRRGRVSKDSIDVKGVTDPAYITALRANTAKLRFVPAVANGCAVPAVVVLPFGYNG